MKVVPHWLRSYRMYMGDNAPTTYRYYCKKWGDHAMVALARQVMDGHWPHIHSIMTPSEMVALDAAMEQVKPLETLAAGTGHGATVFED